MTKMTLCFAFGLLLLSGCYSDPKVLNDQARPLITPAAPYVVPDTPVDRSGMPPIVGLSGSVLTTGPLPVPASGANVILLVEVDGARNKVAELTTGPDGKFEFSQKLKKGKYIIRVDGRRFTGEKMLGNVQKPLSDIIVEVEEKMRLAK